MAVSVRRRLSYILKTRAMKIFLAVDFQIINNNNNNKNTPQTGSGADSSTGSKVCLTTSCRPRPSWLNAARNRADAVMCVCVCVTHKMHVHFTPKVHYSARNAPVIFTTTLTYGDWQGIA